MTKRTPNTQNTEEKNLQPVCHQIDIRPLKAFVTQKLPKDSLLRNVILAERDSLNAQELAGKIETWLNLLRLE